jgi:ABC-type amino acid transport system permease subunit
MRRIILPQAVKRMIPAFMERAIELMKTTTLVATISYADLLFQANEVSQKTFRPLEVYTVVALMYFVVIFLASLVAQAWSSCGWRVSGEMTVHGLCAGISSPSSRTPTCCWSAPPARCASSPSAPWLGLSCWGCWSAWPPVAQSAGCARPATDLRRVLPQHAGAGADPVVLLRAADPAAVPDFSPLAAASLGISLNSAAFSAEIYRGGIAVHRPRPVGGGACARHDAGAQAMRRIVLPQALKRMLPALTNRGIEIFKMSHARLGRRLCRAAAAGQAARVAELQPDRGLYR